MNCFVTKITDSIQNDATHNPMLHKVNEVVIDTSPNASGSCTRCFLIRGDKKGDVYMDVVGNGTIAGETHHEHMANKDTAVTLDVINAPVYVKVGDIDKVTYVTFNGSTLFNNFNFEFIAESFPNVKTITYQDTNQQLINNISSLSNLVNLTSLTISGDNVSGNISSLSNLVNLTTLNVSRTNITGDISSLSKLTNLTELNVAHIGITGDIKTLAKLTQLTSLNTSNCALSGTIESLANEIAKAKVAHVLKIWTNGAGEKKCTITYNGNKAVKRIWTITFAADGTYTVENTDS